MPLTQVCCRCDPGFDGRNRCSAARGNIHSQATHAMHMQRVEFRRRRLRRQHRHAARAGHPRPAIQHAAIVGAVEARLHQHHSLQPEPVEHGGKLGGERILRRIAVPRRQRKTALRTDHMHVAVAGLRRRKTSHCQPLRSEAFSNAEITRRTAAAKLSMPTIDFHETFDVVVAGGGNAALCAAITAARAGRKVRGAGGRAANSTAAAIPATPAICAAPMTAPRRPWPGPTTRRNSSTTSIASPAARPTRSWRN